MAPEQVKAEIQNAYVKALKSSFLQSGAGFGLHHLFRDLRLYGSEAGADFAETHLSQIVKEAVGEAECRKTSLGLAIHRSGRAAIDGFSQRLRELTGLKVEVRGSTIDLIWAEANPGLV